MFQKISLFACFAVLNTSLFGQEVVVSPEQIPDTYIRTAVHENGYAFIAGSSSTECNPNPFVSKVSLATGEVVWSTLHSVDFTYEYNNPIAQLSIMGNDVFALSGLQELWKINKLNGQLDWKISLPTVSNVLIDYSPTQLLILSDQNEHSYNGVLSYTVINKQTGAIESEFTKNQSDFYGVGLNSNEMFVFTDNAFKKVVNLDFANAVSYANVPAAIQKIVALSSTQILLLRKDDTQGTIITLFDLSTSQVVWNKVLEMGSHRFDDVKIQGNYAYFNFEYIYSLSISPVVMVKMNLLTGEMMWKSTPFYNTPPYASNTYYPRQGSADSFDLTSSGDVYVTGLAHGGEWGVMKLSGATGQKIYEKIITQNDADFDLYTNGIAAIVYNDKPYSVGNVIEIATKFVDGPSSSSNISSTSNLATLTELSPSTGEVLKRYTYFGNRKLSSSVVQLSAYIQGDLLKLENQGRVMALSRLDGDGNLIWERKIKSAYSFGHKAVKFAYDTEGNVAVICTSQWLDRFSSNINTYSGWDWIFILNSSGEIIKEINVMAVNGARDIHCDGTHFFVAAGQQSQTALIKLDKNGIVTINYNLSLELKQPAFPGTSQFIECGDNKLLVNGYYNQSIYIDKNTLQGSNTGLMTGVTDVDRTNTTLIKNDTVYFATWDDQPAGMFRTLFCFSLSTKALLWSHLGTNHHLNRIFYEKIVMGSDGFIYAVGQGQYSAMLLRKINRKTGAIVLERQYANDQTVEARDIFYDEKRKEIVVTGRLTATGEYVTMMHNALTFDQTGYYLKSEVIGKGQTISQLSNGNIVTGGEYTESTDCFTQPVFESQSTGLIAPDHVSATDGLKDHVFVSWTGYGSAMYYQVYRNTVNDATSAIALGSWSQSAFYKDDTSTPGVSYYYFVKTAQDNTGAMAITSGTGDSGYRNLDLPELIAADKLNEDGGIEVKWNPVEGATHYQLYRSVTEDSTQAVEVTDWIEGISFQDQGAAARITYYYYVKAAVDEAGNRPSYFSLPLSGMWEIITGVEQHPEHRVVVYPNPFIRNVKVNVNIPHAGEVYLTINDDQGRIVSRSVALQTSPEEEYELELQHLNPGSYFITIRTSENVYLRKIVKH